jgi:hypothetical protein
MSVRSDEIPAPGAVAIINGEPPATTLPTHDLNSHVLFSGHTKRTTLGAGTFRLTPGCRNTASLRAAAYRTGPLPTRGYNRGVKKIEEFRIHAEECRQLAKRGEAHVREQLVKMAATWDALANERERRFAPRKSDEQKEA